MSSESRLIRTLGEPLFPYFRNFLETSLRYNRITKSDLRSIFEQNGSLIKYGETQEVVVESPDAYNTKTSETERMQGVHEISQPFVGVIPDAKLIGTHPLAFHGIEYIDDLAVGPNIRTLNVANSILHTPSKLLSGTRKKNIDEAVLIFHSWVNGYFHWTAESLSRLEGVERYTQATGRQPKVIVGPKVNSFQRETLELLGFGPDELVHWDAAYGRIDRLVVPTSRREIDSGNPSPFVHEWLRSKLRQQCLDEVDTSQFADRVYISRNDAPTRRVVNESEVLELLEPVGFQSYELSKMPVREVIALFAQADIIVGPHGAGFTDIIHTEDVAVVEFMPKNRLNGVYHMITKQVDGWYGCLICETVDDNIKVNITELDKIITAAVNGSQIRGM